MEVFHVGDKVFLDDIKYKYCEKIDIDTEGNQRVSVENMGNYEYGKVMAVNIEDNLMAISPINDKIGVIISVHIDSPHIHKIDFLPKEKVIIHDLLKGHWNKKGIVDVYDRTIDRYRVMVDNDPNPHWFAPFELSLVDNDEDNDDCSEHFIASFLTFDPINDPIKVKLSDEGKKAYEYHFGVKPPIDTNGRTEFTNLTQLMETYDPTFIYGDKYMLEDDEILVKAVD